MIVYDLLYDSSFIVFESMLLVLFMQNSLVYKKNIVVIFVVMSFLQILRRIIFGNIGMLSLIPSSVIDVTVIYFCYFGEIKKKVFLTTAFYAMIFMFDIVATLIVWLFYGLVMKSVVDLDQLLMPSTILSKLMILLVILLLNKTFEIEHNPIEWIKFLPTPIFTIIALVWGSPYTNDLNNSVMAGLLVIICVFSLLSNISLLVSMQRSSEKAKLQYRLKILEENIMLRKEHHQELKAAYRQIEKTAHDIKHHLEYIESASDLESVVKYVHKLKERSFSQVMNFTGNFDIDTILNAKNNEMVKKGITLSINDLLPSSFDWLEPVDVSIILGNGLSNAIEACERCHGEEITVSFRFDNDWLILSIENPTNQAPALKKSGIGLKSSKINAGHGIGMESMATSVERYDGIIKYDVHDGKFRLDILLQSKGTIVAGRER